MREWIDFGKELIDALESDNISFLAAAIAFYAVMSIFPLVLLVVVIGSSLGGEAFASLVVTVVADYLTPQTETLIEQTIIDGPGRGGAGFVSVIVLVWSGLKVFRGLSVAFSVIYGADTTSSFLETVFQAIIVIVAIGIGFLAMFVLNSIAHLVAPTGIYLRLTPIAIFVLLIILFFPVYLVFPTPTPQLRAVLPGTVFAAGGWAILGELFGLYAANATTFALFGVIGGFLLLLTWFYFGALIVLIGAEINSLLAQQTGTGEWISDDATEDSVEERTLGVGQQSLDKRDE